MRRLRLTALLVSLALHGAFVLPTVTSSWPLDLADAVEPEPSEAEPDDAEDAPEEDERDLPIEELENTPFRVSLYVEPPPPAPDPASDPAPEAAPEATLARAEPAPEAPAPETPAEPAAVAPPTPADVLASLPLPFPAPAPAPEPPAEVEPVLTEAERAALAEMEKGDAPEDAELHEDIDDAELAPAPPARDLRVVRHGRPRASRPRSNRPRPEPCPEPTVVSIARVADAHWYIDRDLIEHYATNLVELNKLAWVYTHKGEDGKLDGFRVRLKRCSVLADGGLKSGDVVQDINGRRINTVLQAVGAYLALRKEPELQVRITRRGEPVVLAYTVEQPQRKKGGKKRSQQAAR